MRRSLGVLALAAAALAGCAGANQGWNSADRGGPGVRWGNPYPYPGAVYGRPPWGGGYGGWGFPGRGAGYDGRVVRPGRGVVCDRATATCYRDGEIDASETRDVFGRRAAREVDRVRDQAGTNRVFRADDDVVCNRLDRVCYKDGRPDRSETRDFFGKKAARQVD